MEKYQEQVNSIQIATPCSADWDEMVGDDRKRFCQDCKLNVYNVAELTPREVSELLGTANGGRVCMQIYRRRDGTVITRDCPVAVHRVKKAFKRSIAAVASLAATIGLALPSSAQTPPANATKGESVAYPLRGAIAPPSLGDVESPAQTVSAPDKVVEIESRSRHSCFFGGPLIDGDLLAGFVAAALAFIAFLHFLRKRPAMWIIGISMGGFFAALGYLCCTRM